MLLTGMASSAIPDIRATYHSFPHPKIYHSSYLPWIKFWEYFMDRAPGCAGSAGKTGSYITSSFMGHYLELKIWIEFRCSNWFTV